MAKATATAASTATVELSTIDQRAFAVEIVDKLKYSIGKDIYAAKPHD